MAGPPSGSRTDVATFVGDDHAVATSLLMLSAAESLTDDLVTYLLEDGGAPQVGVERLIQALHECDFVVERNSEWHLSPDVRATLLESLAANIDLSRHTHQLLHTLASDGVSQGEVPRYLTTEVGIAYHGAFLGEPDALTIYGRIGRGPLSGQQWLASRLALEQAEMGVLSADAVEVMFLRGMVLYREGRWSEAEPLLRRVANAEAHLSEVAYAAHIVGRRDTRRFRTTERGQRLLTRSVDLNLELGDWFHALQAMHTLGLVMSKQDGGEDEAVALLRRGLSIARETGFEEQFPELLQTLGAILGRRPETSAEGEGLLRRSLEMTERQDDRARLAQGLHVLGRTIMRNRARSEEAEVQLRRSLEIQEQLTDAFAVAQVSNTLAQLLGRNRNRRDEATSLLQRSLEIGQDINNVNHQAQVLYAMSQVAGTPRADAESLLRQSLSLNQRIGNRSGERIVRRALASLSGQGPGGSSGGGSRRRMH